MRWKFVKISLLNILKIKIDLFVAVFFLWSVIAFLFTGFDQLVGFGRVRAVRGVGRERY